MSSAPPHPSLDARLRDASRSGLFCAQPTAVSRAARIADQAAFTLVELDVKDARDRPSLLQTFARGFRFPDTFGENLDALADCLGDLSWLPSGGFLVHLSGCAKPIEHCKDDFDAIAAVLEDVAAEWRERGTPFWILFDQPHVRARPFMASA
jgi:RNAse (barnase) inhibitor barstar